MPAHDLALADALAAVLSHEAREWMIAPRVEVLFVPDYDERQECTELQLALLPAPQPTATVDRSGPRDKWQLDLFFVQVLTPGDDGQLRELLGVVDEVLDFCLAIDGEALRLQDADGEVWSCTGWQAIRRFDPNQIVRQRHGDDVTYTGVFCSIVSTYWTRIT